jgi:hypothetical protein
MKKGGSQQPAFLQSINEKTQASITSSKWEKCSLHEWFRNLAIEMEEIYRRKKTF